MNTTTPPAADKNSGSSSGGRKVAVALGALLLLGGVAGGWWYLQRDEVPATIAFAAGDGKAGRVEFRLPAGTRPTDAQMSLLTGPPSEADIERIRRAAQDSMAERVKRYHQMTPEEKRKHLDEQIDQQEAVRKEMAKNGVPNLSQPGATTQPGVQYRSEGGPTSRRVSLSIRTSGPNDKQMMEEISPETRAALAQYAADLRARRAERGLPDAPGTMMIRREVKLTTEAPPAPAK